MRSEPQKTLALCWIGIGDYASMFKQFYESFSAHFCPGCLKTFFVFTDQPSITEGLECCKTYAISNACTDRAYVRFRKFFYLLLAEDQLLNYDYAAYMNANLVCQRDVTLQQLLPNGESCAAVLHPYENVLKGGVPYFAPQSRAHFTSSCDFMYKQSGFIVCTAIEFLRMANAIEGWFREDKATGADVTVVAHDETYYNKYMHLREHRISHLKGADYLCPESWPTSSSAYVIQRNKEKRFAEEGKSLETNVQSDLYKMPLDIA